MDDAEQAALLAAQSAQSDTIRRAYAIAVRDLRACYNPDGIVAGRLHFNAYWARDGFWALFGALALGDQEQALAQLNTFMRFQAPSGILPVRVEFVGHTFGSYHTLRTRPKVVGRAGGVFADPIDSTALFLIAAYEYLDRTGDLAFCERFNPVMDRAIGWLMRRDRDGDGILESYFLADWMDSIMKRNKLFNINVIYYVGLKRGEALKRAIGLGDDAERLRRAAEHVHARLQDGFWTGEYFVDWIGRRRRGGFSADGNVFATFFGVATEAQARRILAFIAEHRLDTTTPLRTCYPVYPWWSVFPLYYLAGIPDYHRTPDLALARDAQRRVEEPAGRPGGGIDGSRPHRRVVCAREGCERSLRSGGTAVVPALLSCRGPVRLECRIVRVRRPRPGPGSERPE